MRNRLLTLTTSILNGFENLRVTDSHKVEFGPTLQPTLQVHCEVVFLGLTSDVLHSAVVGRDFEQQGRQAQLVVFQLEPQATVAQHI